jgi:hypothetical protein
MLERLPRLLLRLEGLAVLVAATVLFFHDGNAWWLFALLILAPDLSLLGYLAGVGPGTALYDAAHFYGVPLGVAVAGVVAGSEITTAVGLVWLAHIGLDRMLGYGLKYPNAFKDTHLQRV